MEENRTPIIFNWKKWVSFLLLEKSDASKFALATKALKDILKEKNISYS